MSKTYELSYTAERIDELLGEVDGGGFVKSVQVNSEETASPDQQGKVSLEITKGDVGLGNVTNDAQVKRTEMGAANGVALLDAQGEILSSQIPSSIKFGEVFLEGSFRIVSLKETGDYSKGIVIFRDETHLQDVVLRGLSSPTNNNDAATKKYVDDAIPDVSGFVTKSVNDLVNYYLKSETYTKAEVEALIGAIKQFSYEIAPSTASVASPASNVMYLIGPVGSGSDKYEEYVYPNSTTGWVKIGDTSIDLSGYVQKSDTTGLLKNDGTVDTNTYLTQHQDITGKADKVSEATNGNFAGLDTNGNLTDSGSKATDFATASQGAKADTALQPTNVKTINNQSIVGSGNITVEGGGTDDYTDLDNKPQINSVVLSGNKSASDLGLATSSQGAKADTAYQKPQAGIPETDLSSDVQQALQKHFKGWYDSSSNLPANPVIGDYAYVKGAETTDPAAIYECTTDGSWSDSGRTVDINLVGLNVEDGINDFTISDELNNILVWFSNGHIKTKYFDSSNTITANRFRNKYIAIIGDSISTYSGWLPSDVSGYSGSNYATFYPHGNVNTVNKTWWYKLALKLGLDPSVNISNCSWSGSTTCGDSTSTTSAQAGCSTKRINDLSFRIAQAPDIVICYIGINDWYGNKQLGNWAITDAVASGTINLFRTAYATMINKIHTTYPLARIFCCTILDTRYDTVSGWPPDNTNGETTGQFNDSIREIAKAFGCDIIELSSCGINYANIQQFTTDGYTHPNESGMQMIADKAYIEIMTKY